MGIAFVVLALIAIAFAGIDISSSGTFGGVSGGDRIAVVGSEKIGTAELSRSASAALDRLKQQQPTLTMEVFLANDGLERVVDDIIERYALAGFAKKHGLRAGDRLIDSEIAKIPVFKGPDGSFDEAAFRQAIQQQGFTEQMVRDDLAQSLLAQQIMTPAGFGATVPKEFVNRYAGLLRETRKGSIGLLPSLAYTPQGTPKDKDLSTYYAANREDYIRPERRVLRFATFGPQSLKGLRAPTDAEIAARYKRDAKLYAATETRTVSQLVLSSKSAAQQVAAQVRKGMSLEEAARAQDLKVSKRGPVTKENLARDTSQAVADAAFSAARGTISDPQRSNLGWHLLRVDLVKNTEARSLAQVREAISEQLAAEQRRAALAELTTQIEEQFYDGGSLGEAAKQLGVQIEKIGPVTADGRIYGEPAEQVPEVLKSALPTAFAMEESEPQLAEIEPGKKFLIFEASEITLSAPAPFAEIKDRVTADYKLAKGLAAAKAAAGRVLERIESGKSLAQAFAEEKKPLPRPEAVRMTRDQLANYGQRPPPPLVLMFSMAEGTEKRLEGANRAGWFVVALDEITPGKVEQDDPELERARRQLGAISGQEYQAQLRDAILAEMKVERNQSAIDAVRRQLRGEN